MDRRYINGCYRNKRPCKKYGDNTAVDHLSFNIEKGRVYGFLGPNGTGKSTTMNN